MAELQQRHSEIYNEFKTGHFTVQKIKRAYSAIPLDQAHELNNARIKGDCGDVALSCWVVAGPGVARVIMEFKANIHPNSEQTHHHDTTPSAQKDVQSIVAVMKDLG